MTACFTSVFPRGVVAPRTHFVCDNQFRSIVGNFADDAPLGTSSGALTDVEEDVEELVDVDPEDDRIGFEMADPGGQAEAMRGVPTPFVGLVFWGIPTPFGMAIVAVAGAASASWGVIAPLNESGVRPACIRIC